jgi:hypothetical protein
MWTVFGEDMSTIFQPLAASLILSASLLVGCMAEPDSNATASESSTGEAASALRTRYFGQLINIRSGPSFESPIVYQVPGGTDLAVTCQTYDANGNRWFGLVGNNYVIATALTPGGWSLRQCVGVGFAG